MNYHHTRSADEKLKRKISVVQKKYANKLKKNSPSTSIPRATQKSIERCTNSSNQGSYWSIFYIFVAVAICIVLSSPFTLIPQHDAIKLPRYWYETHIAVYFSFGPTRILYDMMECKLLFNINSLVSLKSFGLQYGAMSILSFVITSICFVILVTFMEYDPPIPLTPLIGYITYLISRFAVWFAIPREERRKPQCRKKFNAYMIYQLVNTYLMKMIYTALTIVLQIVPSEIQWVFVLLLPIAREIRSRLARRVLRKAFEEERMAIVELISTNVQHAFYVSIALATTATQTSAFVILAIDFAINIWSVIKIIKLHRKIKPGSALNSETENEKYSEILELALIELIEVLVPLVYISTFFVAYIGPNSTTLGNYGNGYWNFQPIQNVGKFVLAAGEMFCIDFLSGVAASILMWKFCSINFLKEVCHQIKVYGPLITISLATFLNTVSFSIRIRINIKQLVIMV